MHAEQSLAQIVTNHPETARVFEHHHLDYCCTGNQTLRAACAASGLDLDALLDALAATERGPAEEWQTLGPAALAEHIVVTHHAYLWDELPRLTALAEKVYAVHSDRHPELARVSQLVRAVRADLEPHLTKEEQILFPLIDELDHASTLPEVHCGSVANPIRMMLLEHEHTGKLLTALTESTAGHQPPPDACASYQALYQGLAQLTADIHLHIFKENALLFPAALTREHDLAKDRP